MSDLFTITDTRHGQMVVLSHDNYIGRSLIEYGEWTEQEFDVMAQALRPGDVVADIGANVGSITIPMALKVGAEGCVYSFEPQPRIFQLLAANTVLTGATNARLFHAGCSAEAGSVDIPEIGYQKEFNYGALKLADLSSMAAEMRAQQSQVMVRRVPLVRFDDVFDHDRLKLMKIDVEGMEIDVLRGAQKSIERFRPVLYVENEFADLSPALVGALFDLGYDAWWHMASCFNPANFRGRKDNIFGSAGCLNMLCVPKENAATINGLTKLQSVDEHPRRAA
ncbi:MAG: FkbM family methyltransferase [Beijerinckiaceae bacterium]